MRRRHARSLSLHRSDLPRPSRLACCAALGLAAVAGVASAAPRRAPAPRPTAAAPAAAAVDHVEVWVTTQDGSKRLQREADLVAGSGPADAVIAVHPEQTFQTMVGFGAAITDASAYVIRHDLKPAQADALMRELFSPDGLDLSFTRLTIGASDFSQTRYSYDDAPAAQGDPTLSRFSIEPAKADVLPVVREALKLNPHLTIMATPWSSPGWMKTTGSMIGGTLKPEAYGALADYLVRYVEAMKGEGVPIFALTLQNEPGYEPPDYPGMLLPPQARAAVIGDYLGPELKAKGLDTKILDFDHNWDEPQSPLAVLADAKADPFVSGVAWHCYKGGVAAQSPVHDAHPDKDAYFTECSGGVWGAESAGKYDWIPGTFEWMMKDLIIGSTRGWAKGVILWNLALDQDNGPHLGGCPNCRGVVTVNNQTGEITRNAEYYVLAHASRFVRAGATRISAESTAPEVATVAFQNRDRGSVAVIVLNTAKAERTVAVELRGRRYAYALPAGAAATFVAGPHP